MDRLYASHIIENTLKSLSKHNETLNEKSDIKKARNRVMNDLNLINIMCKELLKIANFNSNDIQQIRNLSNYINTNENQIRYAKSIDEIKDVLYRMNDQKDLNWEFTTSNGRLFLLDILAGNKNSLESLNMTDSNKIIDNININRNFSVFSPRAFDGTSLLYLKNSSDNKAVTYGLEHNDSYHAVAKQVVDRMIKGHISGSTISNKVFDVLHLTLPVSWKPEIGVTGNLLEKKEKYALRNNIKYLRDDGILICSLPLTRITRDMALLFSKILKDVQIIKADNNDIYVYVIGKKEIQSEPREDVYKILINADVNIKEYFNYKYDLPSGGMLLPEFFRGSMLDEEELLEFVEKSGLKSSFWKSQEIKEKDDSIRPLLPFNMGQIGLVLTSGCLDGTVEEYQGQSHAIKGMVTKIRNVENNREGNNETSIETISNKVQINLITPNGEFIELA